MQIRKCFRTDHILGIKVIGWPIFLLQELIYLYLDSFFSHSLKVENIAEASMIGSTLSFSTQI